MLSSGVAPGSRVKHLDVNTAGDQFGAPLDVGTTRYRPSAEPGLADDVRAELEQTQPAA